MTAGKARSSGARQATEAKGPQQQRFTATLPGRSASAIARAQLGKTMSVDAATVRRIAHLARIAVKEDEVAHLQGELNAMLAFVAQLEEVDITGVEPMTSVTPMHMKERDDVVTDGEIAD